MSQSLRLSAVILVVDALVLRRAGVVSFLQPWAEASGVTIVALSPAEALTRSNASPFEMIVLVMGAQRVADAAPQCLIESLQDKYANVPMVLVSDRAESEEVVAAFKAGVRGFIPMSVAPEVAVPAFTFILGGGTYFPPAALVRSGDGDDAVNVIAAVAPAIVAAKVGLTLTIRQGEVLARLRKGESNKVIGRQLKMCVSTVKVHIRQIMRKLGAKNRTEAALSPPGLIDGNDKGENADRLLIEGAAKPQPE